jgi:sorting nexin-41/42
MYAFLSAYCAHSYTNNSYQDHDQPSPPPSYRTTPNDAASSQYQPTQNDLSDEDEDEYRQQQSGNLPRRGYDGRVQQILFENPDLEIMITDAGKSPHGGFIEYRIRTGVRCNTHRLGIC